jgi:hypothetical protein
MIEGEAEITKDLDATVATMIEATDKTESQLSAAASLPEDTKQQMAGKRVLIRVRPKRFTSWDHGKLPSSKMPPSLEK